MKCFEVTEGYIVGDKVEVSKWDDNYLWEFKVAISKVADRLSIENRNCS